MFCKNCGKNLGESTEDLCANCKELANSNLVENENLVDSNTIQSPIVENNASGNNNNLNNNSSKNYNQYNTVNSTGKQKSKIAAGILGIFFGSLGVHNFYLGYTGKALGQLLITLLSCFTLSFISAIWGLIEGILILTGDISTDANGVELKD